MSPSDPRLGVAIARHRAGAVDEAAALYQAILADNPKDADALNLLGVIRQQRGEAAASIALISQALAARADPAFASNLANAFLVLGRFEEAVGACRLALSMNAAFGMAHANLGVALRALGRLDEAEQALRAAIAIEPTRPEAQASLGVVLLELGRRDEAITVLRGLIAARPDYPQGHYNLGNAVASADTPEALAEALPYYDRAVALRPNYAEAHANRAGVLRRLGRLDEAETAYATALGLDPRSPLAHYNHGLLLSELGRAAEALEAYDRALALAPNLAVVHSHRGNVLSALERDPEAIAAHDHALALAPNDPNLHHNLGLTLAHQARFAEAAQAHSQALALNPNHAEAHAALAGCLVELGQIQGGLFSARKAIALKPDLGMAHSALGQALLEAGELDAADVALSRAIELRPTLSQGHLNLGVLRFRQGRLAEGEASYEAALALRPDTWEARYNRGVVRLQRGDYAQGWADFEDRLRGPARRRQEANYPQALWTDQDLAGETILVHAEQGLGDVIQCLRFIPQVATLGATVIVEAPEALRRLVEPMPGVARFIGMGQPQPEARYHAPLFSLPHRLGVTLERLPGAMPYLHAPEVLAEAWRERVVEAAPGPGPRVGVVWSGNIHSKVDRGRSIPLADYAPLAAAVGAPLISLQKQYGLDELAALPAGMAVTVLGEAYDAGDLADTAAVIEALDMVVACDTAVAHLAGSLNKPVWLAVNAIADWRWLTRRSDSPWYPSVTVYRQPTPGDWPGVFEAMARDWLENKHRS
jgi:tetratricopeptide (TPR) repeat protein